jgi:hypothetical protein
MKVIKNILLSILMLSTLSLTAGNMDSLKLETKRDVQVELSARVIEGEVYFKLLMLNESKPGFYSLVKEYADGTFESVGLKEIGVNTINQPLMYCFVDKSKSIPVKYKLSRISNEVETLKTWVCSELVGEFYEDQMVLLEK